MYATWPMVFGALVAGAVGGVMVPERPASSPSAVSKWASGNSGKETAGKPAAAKPVDSKPVDSKPADPIPADTATAKPAPTPVQQVRAVGEAATPAPKAAEVKATGVQPATSSSETQGAATKVAAQPNDTSRASCEAETWPYRTPNCLDRTAAVLPAETVVKTKRVVDPGVSIKGNEKSTAAAEKPATTEKAVATEKKLDEKTEKKLDEKAETEKKTASVGPDSNEEAEPKEKRTERTARAESDDREIRSAPAKRSTQRRLTNTRRAASPDNEYTGRVYYRDSNGRLFLAPEMRNQLPPPPSYWR